MNTVCSRLLLALVAILHLSACSDGSDSYNTNDQIVSEAESEATAVLERHMVARNASDAEGIADTNNYPLIRLSGGGVQTFETWEIYKNIEELIVIPALEAAGWVRSSWDEMHIVQSSENKVHFALDFSRYDETHEPYSSTQTFYIVNLQNGNWGNVFRSSYDGDPTLGGENAEAEQAAISVLERRLDARNRRDSEDLAALNTYPMVYLADAEQQVFNTLEDYIVYEETEILPRLDYAGWERSNWKSLEIVHSSEKKVHIATVINHLSVTGDVYRAQDQFYVVVELDGEWKIQAMSHFIDAIQRTE